MRLFSAKLSAFLLLFASGNAFSPALEPVIHFSVGAVAGSVGAVAAYPFDYIKSQLQSEYGKRRYKNGWECAVDTWKKHQSPLIFYKGVGVQILGIAPEKGIKLGVNDVLREMSVAQLQGFPLWAQVLAGGTAGACQVVASSPLEVLKVGLQTSDMDFQQVWTQVGGFKGLFRGAEACIFRDITFTAICFPLYQHWVHELGMNTFVAGAMSGVIASFVATPPDVIKTRILSQDPLSRQRQKRLSSMASFTTATTTVEYEWNGIQTRPSLFASNSTEAILESYSDQDFVSADPSTRIVGENPSPWQVLRTILKEEGPAVLFSGVSERCMGAIPRFGTTLAMHDFFEHALKQAGMLS